MDVKIIEDLGGDLVAGAVVKDVIKYTVKETGEQFYMGLWSFYGGSYFIDSIPVGCCEPYDSKARQKVLEELIKRWISKEA